MLTLILYSLVCNYRIWEALEMGSIPIVEHTDPALWPAEKHYLNGPAMHGHPLLVVRNWTELAAIFEKYRDTALLEEKSAEIRRWWINFKVQLQINVSLHIEKGFTKRNIN